MNREKARALLPIIEAYAEGKIIQRRNTVNGEWRDATAPLEFGDLVETYRIKPEPRKVWIGESASGSFYVSPGKEFSEYDKTWLTKRYGPFELKD